MASPTLFLSRLVSDSWGWDSVEKHDRTAKQKNPNTNYSEKSSLTRSFKTFTALYMYSSAPLHCLQNIPGHGKHKENSTPTQHPRGLGPQNLIGKACPEEWGERGGTKRLMLARGLRHCAACRAAVKGIELCGGKEEPAGG